MFRADRLRTRTLLTIRLFADGQALLWFVHSLVECIAMAVS